MKSQLAILFVVLFTGSVFAQLTLKKVTESELYQTLHLNNATRQP